MCGLSSLDVGEPGGQPATGKEANAAARNTPARAAGTPVALGPDRLTDVAARGVAVPMYDRGRLAPRVAHIGVGGFHRAHLAVYLDELAAAGGDWGIGGLGVLPADRAMAAALGPQDCLYTLIERGAGEPHAAVIGSLVDYRHTAGRPQESIDRLADPGVAIVSMTITEAGYALDGPGAPTFELLAAALDVRRRSGAPVTVLSCDNLPGNGAAARRATLAAAARVDAALATWIEEHCSFPNSMVDRITPVTADADRAWLLEAHGISTTGRSSPSRSGSGSSRMTSRPVGPTGRRSG